jgi:hypothetical protein
MNIAGITSIKNFPASRTWSNFITPVSRHTKRITIPYILAGIGNGNIVLSISSIPK